MVIPDTVSAREVMRNYKKVFEKVKKTKKPLVVVSRKQPQVAIVSLSDLDNLQQLQKRNSTKALLDLAGIIPKGSGLPTDLSEKHNEYTWD